MLFDADRSDPRSATAVRDTESLVQVQVGNIAAEFTRRANPDHRVHVGAVDVDLPTVLMNQRANFGYIVFEYTVRRWGR